MGAELRAAFLLVFSVISFGCSAPPPPKGHQKHEKIIIPKTDPFEHEVPLPPDVLKALLDDDGIKSMQRHMTDYQRSHPDKLFGASEVRLGPPDEVDFIVFGMPPLCGVSFDWYWVVRPTLEKPEVVFFATGKAIELLQSRTHGYRDIRTIGGTGWILDEEIYHFDGKEYKLWKKRSENRPSVIMPR